MTFTDMDFDKHRLAPLEVAVKMYTPCYWSKRLYCAASCNENVKINFKIYADRHLHTTERQGISREAHKKHWIIIKKKFFHKSVISTSRLLYIFSLYQIICLLFKRVWIESLYSRLLCYGCCCCCCCYYYYSFEIFLFSSFSHFGTFCKGHLHDLVYHWKAMLLLYIFRSLRNIGI